MGILGTMMSNSINSELLEKVYEVLEVVGDSDLDLTIKINEAIHTNDLEELLFLLNDFIFRV
jgi:hypothetical protein